MPMRARFGRFFWRFQGGESGADVYDRVTKYGPDGVRVAVLALRLTGCRLFAKTSHPRMGEFRNLSCSGWAKR